MMVETLESKKNHLYDKNATYITHIDFSLPLNIKKVVNNNKKKISSMMIPCPNHPDEYVKFIDITSETFESLCDLCVTSSTYILKKMRLERLIDLTSKFGKETTNFLDELERLNYKMSYLNKEIIKNNAGFSPIIAQINDMEKHASKLIKDTFNKLRQSYLKSSPYQECKELLKYKIDESLDIIKSLNIGNNETLITIKELLTNSKKVEDIRTSILIDLKNKISNVEKNGPLTDEDFNMISYGFKGFYNIISIQSDKWLKIAKIN